MATLEEILTPDLEVKCQTRRSLFQRCALVRFADETVSIAIASQMG